MNLPNILPLNREYIYKYLSPAQNFIVRFGDLCKENIRQIEEGEIAPDIDHLRSQLQAFFFIDEEKADLYMSVDSAAAYKRELAYVEKALSAVQDDDNPLTFWKALHLAMLHRGYESLCQKIDENDEEWDMYETDREADLATLRQAWDDSTPPSAPSTSIPTAHTTSISASTHHITTKTMIENNMEQENVGIAFLRLTSMLAALVWLLWLIVSCSGLLDLLAGLDIIRRSTAEFIPRWGLLVYWPPCVFLGILGVQGTTFREAIKCTLKTIAVAAVFAIPFALLAGVIAVAIYYGLRMAFFVFLLIGTLFIPGFLKKCGGS